MAHTYGQRRNTQTIEVSQSGNYSVVVQNGQNNSFSMNFDDAGYVNLGNQIDLIDDLIEATIKLWILMIGVICYFVNQMKHFQPIVCQGYMLHVSQGILKLGYRLENGGSFSNIDSNISMNENEWYHIAITRNQDQITFYINGNYVGLENYPLIFHLFPLQQIHI